MGRLDNKVAVVTGAAQGIGAFMAKALADEGAKVLVSRYHLKRRFENDGRNRQ